MKCNNIIFKFTEPASTQPKSPSEQVFINSIHEHNAAEITPNITSSGDSASDQTDHVMSSLVKEQSGGHRLGN